MARSRFLKQDAALATIPSYRRLRVATSSLFLQSENIKLLEFRMFVRSSCIKREVSGDALLESDRSLYAN